MKSQGLGEVRQLTESPQSSPKSYLWFQWDSPSATKGDISHCYSQSNDHLHCFAPRKIPLVVTRITSFLRNFSKKLLEIEPVNTWSLGAWGEWLAAIFTLAQPLHPTRCPSSLFPPRSPSCEESLFLKGNLTRFKGPRKPMVLQVTGEGVWESSWHSASDSIRPAQKSGWNTNSMLWKRREQASSHGLLPLMATAMDWSQRSSDTCTKTELILMSLTVEIILDYHEPK